MKIALALETTFDSDAGVQQYFKSLGRYLLRKGYDVHFIATHGTDTGEFQGRIISLGKVMNPKLLNTTSVPVGIYSPLSKIHEVIDKYNFDVIHCGIPVSPYSLGRLIQHARCPVIGTFMSHSHDPRQRFWMYLTSSVLMKTHKYLDILTAPNRVTGYDASHVIPGKYHIIPHAIDMTKFRSKNKPLERFKDHRPVILFLGRLDRRKGVHYLLDAFPSILKRVPNAHLIIAGNGPLKKQLEAQVLLEKISYAVDFAGYVQEEEKAGMYATADICVFPATHGECFGVVLVEALSSGKIPIAFANEGYRSVLENLPETLVPVGNKKELANRIVYYLTHPRQKKDLERKCRYEARRFDWISVGPQFIKLYKKAIRDHQKSNPEQATHI